MAIQKKSKLLTEQVWLKEALNENVKALEFYRTYKEISNITEKIDIAMGRKQTYKYIANSTQNCEINHHASSTTEKYQV